MIPKSMLPRKINTCQWKKCLKKINDWIIIPNPNSFIGSNDHDPWSYFPEEVFMKKIFLKIMESSFLIPIHSLHVVVSTIISEAYDTEEDNSWE